MKAVMNRITAGEAVRHACDAINGIQEKLLAEVIDGKLVVSWNYKDATVFGLKSVSKEWAEFRYVVTAKEDGTFYGYDTDAEKAARLSSGGRVTGSTTSFVGHEVRYRKEIAIGKNKEEENIGVQEWTFSTDKIHGPVKELFEEMGYVYKEPAVHGAKLEGPEATPFKFAGIIITGVSLIFCALFLSIGVWPGLLIALLCGAFGIVAIGWGTGRIPVPVFSFKAGVIIILGMVFGSWVLVFVILLIVMMLNGGSL